MKEGGREGEKGRGMGGGKEAAVSASLFTSNLIFF